MPTAGTRVSVPMAFLNADDTCCAHCLEPIPKTLYLSNNYGLFTLAHNPTLALGQWSCTFPADVPNAAPHEIDVPRDCYRPVDSDLDDTVVVKAVVSCPTTTGGKWSLVYSSAAETLYHRLVGTTFPTSNRCTYYSTETVPSDRVDATAAGCSTTRTFPAPSRTWTGPTGHAYLICPDVGTSGLSA